MTVPTTNDAVVIPNTELPAPSNAPAPTEVPPEIAYLREHGMDGEANSLASELESLLRSRDNAPAVTPTQAPITQAPPVVPATPTSTPAPVTPQEKALDPYAPEGADGDDASVVIDADGRARDAKTGKYVPIKALHHEREQHKQTKQQLREVETQNARVEERLALLNELLTADETTASAPTPPEPTPALQDEELVDPEQDIFKFAKQMIEREKRRDAHIRQLEEKLNNTDQNTAQKIEAMQADQAIRSDVTSHVAKNPNFFKAYEHLRSVRDSALKALGYADEGQRAAYIANEEKALMTNSIKQKRSYAETIYNLAMAHGYAPPAPTPEPTPAPPASAPAPATPPAVNAEAAAKVEAIRNGKELASATLTGAGGSAAEGLTVSQLANMSEADFLNLAAKLGGKGRLDTLLRGA